MINVLERSREFSKVEEYLMTLSNDIVSIKDVPDGTKIAVDGYIVFEDVKKDGEVVEIFSIITPDKKVYSAQSATFRENVIDIAMCLGKEPYPIIKKSGKTKNGRDFVSAALDVAALEPDAM